MYVPMVPLTRIHTPFEVQFNIPAHESNGAQRLPMAYQGGGINRAVSTKEESL